jgi:hypothetical protein
MPIWLKELMTLLGFPTPLILAAATYLFFHWLDNIASVPAKEAISALLMPREYDRADVRLAILELFDRVYTHPLFAWRAFRRSAVITIGIVAVVTYEVFQMMRSNVVKSPSDDPVMYLSVPIVICVTIISDYLSLFVVRWQLANEHTTTMKAFLLAPLIGIVVVFSFPLLVVIVTLLLGYTPLVHQDVNLSDNPVSDTSQLLRSLVLQEVHLRSGSEAAYVNTLHLIRWLRSSAFLVHMWLPFLGLCIGLLRPLYYFILATQTAQWFLRRGREHPLEAVGFVAALLVFLVTAVVQWMLR